MRGTKLYAMFVAMFMAGAFLASPELRAFAANTVGSADIINESILSVDIKNGEVKTDDIAPSAIGSLRIKDNDVKAQDIAPDAVGASELQGVVKLIFADCNVPAVTGSKAGPGVSTLYRCPVAGIDPEDEVIATKNNFDCYVIQSADIIDTSGTVQLTFTNVCTFSASRGAGHVSIIVYDELPD